MSHYKYPLALCVVLVFIVTGYGEAKGGLYTVCPGVCDLGWSPTQDLLGAVNEFGLWLYSADETDTEPTLFPFENATSLDFSPDGESIAITACLEIREDERDCTSLISIFDLETQTWEEIARYEFEVVDIQFSPDGNWLAVEQKKIGLWGLRLIDLSSREELTIIDRLRTNSTIAYAFSPDGEYLANVNSAIFIDIPEMFNGISVWELATRELIAETSREGWLIRDVMFSPDSAIITYVESDSQVTEWDYQNNIILSTRTFDEVPWDTLDTFALVEQPSYLIASLDENFNTSNRILFAWDLATGIEMFSYDMPPDHNINLIDLSASGRFFSASSNIDETTIVDLWDITTNEHRQLDFSP